MKPFNKVRGAASYLTILCFLLNSVSTTQVFAAKSEPSLDVKIPAQFGSVEKIFKGSGSFPIIYIQDAHSSFEAQENIAKLISHLVKSNDIKTVFTEGYEGEVPLDSLYPFDNSEIKEKVSRRAMDYLRLSGAQYAFVNRTQNFKLIGIDGMKEYLANLKDYEKAAKNRAAVREDLKAISRELKALGDRLYPKEIKEWLKLKERLDSRKISMADYLSRFMKMSGLKMENAFPNLEKINSHVFFEKLSRYENTYTNYFLKDKNAREVLRYQRGIDLFSRLNLISITPEEYAQIELSRSDFKTEALAKFLSKNLKKTIVVKKEWESLIENAIQFYETAKKRDGVFRKNLKLNEPSILVTGGFHKDAMLQYLEAKKISYILVSPKITQEDWEHQERYDFLMSGKFYNHEKPFLSMMPVLSAVPPASQPVLELLGVDVVRENIAAANQEGVVTSQELVLASSLGSYIRLLAQTSLDMELIEESTKDGLLRWSNGKRDVSINGVLVQDWIIDQFFAENYGLLNRVFSTNDDEIENLIADSLNVNASSLGDAFTEDERELVNAMLAQKKLQPMDVNYLQGLLNRFREPKRPLKIGTNFKPSSMLTVRERETVFGRIPFETVERKAGEASRNVALTWFPLDAGIGSSVERSKYKEARGVLNPKQLGAKATDLYFTIDGGKNGKVELSIAEIKLLRAIHERPLYSEVVYQPLVNDESDKSYLDLLDRTKFLPDRLDDTIPEVNKRTYREAATEVGIVIGDLLYQNRLPTIDKSTVDISLEQRQSGLYLGTRFVKLVLDTMNGNGGNKADEYLGEPAKVFYQALLARNVAAEKRVLGLITSKAKEKDGMATVFIKEAGEELGIAIGTFMEANQEKKFSKHIVLVGSVAENFGKEVTAANGKDLWLSAIQEGAKKTLLKAKVDPKLAQEMSDGIVRSTMQHDDREFLVFAPIKPYQIAVTLGGTNIRVAGVNVDGEIFGNKEFGWRERFGPNATGDQILSKIVELIKEVKDEGGIRNLFGVGISFAGPGDYERGVVTATNINFAENYPLKAVLESRLPKELSKAVKVEVMHDGAAAVMGETSVRGSLSGFPDAVALIVGSGIGGGIKENGKQIYGRGALGEIGMTLWYEDTLQGPTYRYDGDLTLFDHKRSLESHNKKKDISLEERLAGLYLGARFVERLLQTGEEEANDYFGENVRILYDALLLKNVEAEKKVLKLITDRAQENGIARAFLEESGNELGVAIGTFMTAYQGRNFSKHIVLVGGLAEKFGEGVKNNKNQDLWLSAIREGARKTLLKSEVPFELANEMSNGIIRSTMKYERDFLAFAPDASQAYQIAITVGGTKIRVAGVNEDGDIFDKQDFEWRKELGADATGEQILKRIIELISELQHKQNKKNLLGVGVSFAGPGDYKNGVVTATNINFDENYPLQAELTKRLAIALKKKVYVNVVHDGLAAVMAETSVKGTFKNASDAVALIVGTGIGGGVLEDGEPTYGEGTLGESGWKLWYHETPEGPSYTYEKDSSYAEHMANLNRHKGTGKLVENHVAPGGHGYWGVFLLKRALGFVSEVHEGVKTHISAFFNGDNTSAGPDEKIVGWMAEERVPVVMVTTEKSFIDKKGGMLGLETTASGKLRPQMMEIAQAKEQGQEPLFQEIGLPGGKGESGEQDFNTNLAFVNDTVLSPLLNDLVELIGEDEFFKITSPDLIRNDKEKQGKWYTQLEGAIGSVLLNLNAYFETTDNEEVRALFSKHKIGKLLRIVYVPLSRRSQVFTPVKTSFDFWLQSHSDYYQLNRETWRLEDAGQNMVPPLIEIKDPFYNEVQNLIEAFGYASTRKLHSLTIDRGVIKMKDAVLEGDVRISNQTGQTIDLGEPKYSEKIPKTRDPKTGNETIFLINTHITIKSNGDIEIQNIASASSLGVRNTNANALSLGNEAKPVQKAFAFERVEADLESFRKRPVLLAFSQKEWNAFGSDVQNEIIIHVQEGRVIPVPTHVTDASALPKILLDAAKRVPPVAGELSKNQFRSFKKDDKIIYLSNALESTEAVTEGLTVDQKSRLYFVKQPQNQQGVLSAALLYASGLPQYAKAFKEENGFLIATPVAILLAEITQKFLADRVVQIAA